MKYLLIFYLILVFSPGSKPALAQENNDNPGSGNTIRKKNPPVIYGTASYYSNKFQNRRTASGEIFDQNKMTAACNVLPLGTWIRVTNLRNKRSIFVKVNDRLHGRMKRAVDLSREAARQLGFLRSGLTKVKVEDLGKKKPF